LSTVPSVRTTCLTVRTLVRPSIIRPDNVHFPSEYLSVIDQLQILSKFRIRENWYTRPNDMDSRLDALIHKARIAIQISPSGWQSALVRTRVHQLMKLPIRLQSSEHAHSKYGNCVLKFSRTDAHPPWSGRAKPYMESNCRGRATVWKTVSYRPDAALK
jgi:hypothetical protein